MNIHTERYKQQIISSLGSKQKRSRNHLVKEQQYNNGVEENIISIEQIGDSSVLDYDVSGVDFDLRQDDTVRFLGFVKNDSGNWKQAFAEDAGGKLELLKACRLKARTEDGVATGWFPLLLKSPTTAVILSY